VNFDGFRVRPARKYRKDAGGWHFHRNRSPYFHNGQRRPRRRLRLRAVDPAHPRLLPHDRTPAHTVAGWCQPLRAPVASRDSRARSRRPRMRPLPQARPLPASRTTLGPQLAANGIAFIRLDRARLRRSSEGVITDEYSEALNSATARKPSAGLARRDWCNGARRHARHRMGRHQRAAGRGPPSAGAEGDHADGVMRPSPYTRRRALHRRRSRTHEFPVGRALRRRRSSAGLPDPLIHGERWLDLGAANASTPHRPSSPHGCSTSAKTPYWKRGSVAEARRRHAPSLPTLSAVGAIRTPRQASTCSPASRRPQKSSSVHGPTPIPIPPHRASTGRMRKYAGGDTG